MTVVSSTAPVSLAVSRTTLCAMANTTNVSTTPCLSPLWTLSTVFRAMSPAEPMAAQTTTATQDSRNVSVSISIWERNKLTIYIGKDSCSNIESTCLSSGSADSAACSTLYNSCLDNPYSAVTMAATSCTSELSTCNSASNTTDAYCQANNAQCTLEMPVRILFLRNTDFMYRQGCMCLNLLYLHQQRIRKRDCLR